MTDLRSEILRAAHSPGKCCSRLVRTVEAVASYITAMEDSADIDAETGEVIRDGMPKYYEGFTREDFIDPLLLALGWDVKRKRHVRIERRIDYDRVADYVLYHSTREAFAIVEAKNIYEELAKHEPQLFNYMHAASAAMGILTNSIHWRIYRHPDANGIEMEFELKNILDGLDEANAAIMCDLIGFSKNYRSGKSISPRKKTPSPLEDGWVET